MRLTRISRSMLLLGSAALCLLAAACAQTSVPVTGVGFVMDTVLEYKLYAPSQEQAEEAAQAVQRVLSGLETETSMFLPNSAISQLNREAGVAFVRLPEHAYALLQLCAVYHEQSEGVFDMTIAPLTKLWDVTSENPRIPEAHEIETLLPLVDGGALQFDEEHRAVMLPTMGMQVDIGGVAKGYACDLARATALEHGVTQGYISIGGNLMVIGDKSRGEPFRFGVRDPRGSQNDFLAVITLPDSTMATSGDYERFFERDGVRYHHILDPKTGYPAQSDLMSVSVVTPDGAYADFMSTWLFIKGKTFTLERLNSFSCGLIVIDQERNIYVSDSLKKQFSMSDSTESYHYEVDG